MIYLDNAATTGKKPSGVINAVNKALQRNSANPGRSGHKLSDDTAVMVYNARETVADFFSAQTENVIFTQNCTMSLNMAIKGNIKSGDHVIISSYEHNAVLRPIYKLSSEGIEYDVANVIVGDKEATYRAFERLIKSNTKMIVCTHASNVTGELMPIEMLAELCKQKGIIFVVDAAQTAGVLPIALKDGMDYLCIASHKGLYAPMGTGILVCGRPVEKTVIEGGTGTFSNVYEQPTDMPERLESGTLNVPGIAGIKAGIDFVKEKTIDRIYRHEISLVQLLYDNLEKMSGIRLYMQRPEVNKTAPVLSFNVEGKNSMETADYLSKNGIAVRAGLHCAVLAHKTIGTVDVGTVRVCTSVFNTKNDIFSFIDVLKRYK